MDQPDTGPGLPRRPRQALGVQLPRGLQPGPEHADPRFSPGSRPGLCGQDLSGGRAGSPEGGAAARRGGGFCMACPWHQGQTSALRWGPTAEGVRDSWMC